LTKALTVQMKTDLIKLRRE